MAKPSGLLRDLSESCHSEPVRSSAANGPERGEGAQGKLREESRSERKAEQDSSSPAAPRNDTVCRFLIGLLEGQLSQWLPSALHLESQNRGHGRRDVDVAYGAFRARAVRDSRAQRQQPDAAARVVTAAMVGEAVAVDVTVASYLGDHEHRRAALIQRRILDVLPQPVGEPVGAFDGLEVERIRAIVRDVDVPEIDQQQRRRKAVHHFFGHEESQLVAARRHGGIVEIVEERLREARLQLFVELVARVVHLPAVAFVSLVKRREHLIEKRLAILNAGPFVRCDRRLDRFEQKLLGQDDVRRNRVAVAAHAARADQAEALVGGNHPGLLGGEPALLAEVFEDGGGDGRLAAESVDVLPRAGDQRGTRVEVTRESLVERNGVEQALRSQVARQVRDVHPAFGREGVLIAAAPAKSYDDGALLRLRILLIGAASPRAARQEMVSEERRRQLQEITAARAPRGSGFLTRNTEEGLHSQFSLSTLDSRLSTPYS